MTSIDARFDGGVEWELAELGRDFLGLPETEQTDYLSGCDEVELEVLGRAITAAELEGADWRDTPATMAVHLTGGVDVRPYRYFMLMGEFIAERFRGAAGWGTAMDPRWSKPGQLWTPKGQIWIPSQMGKGLSLDTLIPTPDGWTRLRDLRAGDWVIDGDGVPVRVTFLSEDRLLDCYEVTTYDRSVLVADGDHHWQVWDSYGHDPAGWAETRQKGCWKVVTTRDLAANPKRYRLPATPMVTLPDRELPIAPYAFGCWLGDGSSSSAGLTCADDEILEHLADVGEPAVRCGYKSDPYACTWAGTKAGPRAGKFVTRLRALGVLRDKHIPDRYARAGDKQRLDLLQGLMDTDGSAYRLPSGYTQCEYTSTNERLAEDVLSLARSLGIRASLHPGRATLNGRDIGPKWRIRFTAYLPVFRLSRKARLLDGQPDGQRQATRVGIRSVTPVDPVVTRCIQVDSPSRTYLAGRGMTVTHNTSLLANWMPVWALDRNPKLRIIYVSFDAAKAVEEAGKARDLAEEYQGLLRFRLRKSQRARGRWTTDQGGGVYAVGLYGGMAGWPADVLAVDDLFKNWQDAHSPTRRDNAWNFLISQARKRLQARWNPRIYSTTRWHEDDPPNRFLELAEIDPRADQEAVLRLPARARPAQPKHQLWVYRLPDPLGRADGEIIEPDRFDEQEVDARAAGSQYLTDALEQQEPTAQEGGEIRRSWFRIRDSAPAEFQTVQAFWDMKLKDNQQGDFVVGGCWGRQGSALWLLDVLRGQWNQDMTECAITLMKVRHPAIELQHIENTGNGPEVMAALRRAHDTYEVLDETAAELRMTDTERAKVQAIRRRGIGQLVSYNPKGPKEVRMRAQIGSLRADTWLLEGPWNAHYVDEMVAFGPNSAHDDQVDMTSMALHRLAVNGATVTRPQGTTPTATAGATRQGSTPTGPPPGPAPKARVRSSNARITRIR